MKDLTDKAIILKRIEYGESDKIITLLTQNNGKITVMAKGIRKQRSKLAGSMELFSTIDITFLDGRSDLKTVVSARLITHYGSIAADLHRSMFLYEALKQLDKLTESECGSEYYTIAEVLMESLADDRVGLELSKMWFLQHVMYALGYRINLKEDSHGEKFDQLAAYAFMQDDMSFMQSNEGTLGSAHIKILKLAEVYAPVQLLNVQHANDYAKDLAPLLLLALTAHAF